MITIDRLTKVYGTLPAIQDISFDVKRGEVLGFLGPNGAGKTTTMKIITSFMPPTSGSVKVAGYDTVSDAIQVKRLIGYLPENNPLYPEMRVNSFLKFVAKAKGVKKRQIDRKVDDVILECGLDSVRHRIIGKLSKGFQQRVGLAQALVNSPPVLILDEPTLGLDPIQIYEIRQLIGDLSGSRTIILSSHILPEVSSLCGRVAIINKGKIVAIDTTANLTEGLQDYSRIEVKVGDNAEEAIRTINSLDGVISTNSSNSSITVKTARGKDLRPVIAKKLVEASIPLLEITRKDMSLEDIFLELVTEEEGIQSE